MAELADGDSIEIQGSTNVYTISRSGDVYSCSCPAWRHQRLRVEDRSCKHIRAFIGDYLGVEVAPIIGVPEYEELESVRKRREEILADALERYVVLHDRMEEVFGLRMPEELAYFAGFFLSLSENERAFITTGEGLLGPAKWFAGDDPTPIADERLRDRERDDFPEFIPVLTGRKTERWGLWYDDPRELPNTVHRGQSTGADVIVDDPTLLRSWLNRLLYPMPGTVGPDGIVSEPEIDENDPRYKPIFAWMGEVARREARVVRSTITQRRGYCVGGIPPYGTAGTLPPSLLEWQPSYERRKVYEANGEAIDEWIAESLQDLKEGAAGRALLYGRELHAYDIPSRRTATSELLIRGYVLLGRRALADMVRAHYLARDPEIPVFEMPPPHAIVVAARDADPLEIAALIAEAPPTSAEIAEAMAATTSLAVANALLDLDETQSESALMRRLNDIAGRPKVHVQAEWDLAQLFLKRGVVTARAFARTLINVRDDELTAIAVERVDVFSEDARGATALHLASGMARPAVVRTLLDRGADACAEDNRGRKPYESARAAWRHWPREVGEIFAMLDAAGGGEKKKDAAPPAEWTVGMTVRHAKFGEGVVEEVTGTGEETKLKIAFAAAAPPEKSDEAAKPAKKKAASKKKAAANAAAAKKPEYKVLLAKFVSK